MLPALLLVTLAQLPLAAAAQAARELRPAAGCHVGDEADFLQVSANLSPSPLKGTLLGGDGGGDGTASAGKPQPQIAGLARRDEGAAGGSRPGAAHQRLERGLGNDGRPRNPLEFASQEVSALADFLRPASQNPDLTAIATVVALVFGVSLLWGVGYSVFRAQSPPRKAGARLGWYQIMILIQSVFMQPFSQGCYLPSLPDMVRQLGTIESMVCWSLEVSWFMSGVVCLAIGIGADHFGRRPMFLLGMLCYVSGALCASLAPTVEYLIVARILQCIGEGTSVLCYTIARDAIQDEDERAKLFSMFCAVATTAITIAPAAGGAIAAWGGWRSVCLLLTGWGIIIFVHAMVCLPETLPGPRSDDEISFEATRHARPQELQEGPMKKVATVLQQSCEPWVLFLTMWIMGPLMMGVLANMPLILEAEFGTSTDGIFWVLSMFACLTLLGSGVALVLLRHLTSRGALQLTMMALLLTGLLFCAFGRPFLPIPPLPVFVAFPALFIFVQAMMQGPIRSLIAQPFGEAAGTAMGLVSALDGPLAAVVGFGLTRLLEVGGARAWMLCLGVITLVQQTCWWPLMGFSAAGVFRAPAEEPTKVASSDSLDGELKAVRKDQRFGQEPGSAAADVASTSALGGEIREVMADQKLGQELGNAASKGIGKKGDDDFCEAARRAVDSPA